MQQSQWRVNNANGTRDKRVYKNVFGRQRDSVAPTWVAELELAAERMGVVGEDAPGSSNGVSVFNNCWR